MTITIYILLFFAATPYPVIRYYEWRTLGRHDPAAADEIRDALHWPMRRLWWAWLVAVVVCATATAVLGVSSDTNSTLFGLAFAAFHLVWWPFAVPVVNMLNKELESRGLQQGGKGMPTQRTASLTPRTLASYLPVWALAAPWLLAIACTGYLAWSAARMPPPDPRDWTWFAVFVLVPWGCLALHTWWLRNEVSQSYPMHGSKWKARLRDVESMRRFRVRGVYVLMLAMMLSMFYNARLALELVQESPLDAAAGGYGGVAVLLGLFVGLLGAAFGIEASFRYQRAMRVNGVATPTAENGVDPGH